MLGGVAVALFAVLFFRLWNLQVLAGDEYLAEAKNNRTREYKVIAPRGDILDRDGNVLVDNRTSLALQLEHRRNCPKTRPSERAELTRLGELAHMSLRKVRRTIDEERRSRRRGAGDAAPRRRLRPRLLPRREPAPLPRGRGASGSSSATTRTAAVAAHVLGNVGEVSEEELKEARYKDLEPGDEIGQAGVEYTYDKYLRGEPGLTRIQVNALGQPTPGGQLVSDAAAPGDNLKLTIDADSAERRRRRRSPRAGLPGAFVSMNVDNGEILGMGSYPTYDPTDPHRTEPGAGRTNCTATRCWRRSPTARPKAPTRPARPSRSSPPWRRSKTAQITPRRRDQRRRLDRPSAARPSRTPAASPTARSSLRRALQVSSDVYFYMLGLDMWNDERAAGLGAQARASADPTGLDLPEEAEGLLPSKAVAQPALRRKN